MGSASRRKGVAGEREVAALFQAAGFAVRGLEGEGDHLVIHQAPANPAGPFWFVRNVPPLHSEVKRQERLRLPEWLRQAEREAPQGTVPLVCFRQNRGEWYAVTRLTDFVGLIT